MSLRREIDVALAAIGHNRRRGGLGAFRAAAVTLGGELSMSLGAGGRRITATAADRGADRVGVITHVQIDRHGQLTERRAAIECPDEPLEATARALALTLGASTLSFSIERSSPALETVVATARVAGGPRFRDRFARALALRPLLPSARASALAAAAGLIAAGDIEVSIAAAAGELLPEIFVATCGPRAGAAIARAPWFPPPLSRLRELVAACAEVTATLAISAELGLGIGATVSAPTWPELPPPRDRAADGLEILAATSDLALPAAIRVAFAAAVLAAPPPPLPGRSPAARRAHARALAAAFARTGRLPGGSGSPAALARAARAAPRVGLARAVVASAAG